MDQSQLQWWRWGRAVLALVLACFITAMGIEAAWSTVLDTSTFPPMPREVRNTESTVFGLVYILVALGFICTGIWKRRWLEIVGWLLLSFVLIFRFILR